MSKKCIHFFGPLCIYSLSKSSKTKYMPYRSNVSIGIVNKECLVNETCTTRLPAVRD